MRGETAGAITTYFVVGTIFLCGLFIGGMLGFWQGYRQGQIDAQEGRVKYRPTTQVVWEEAK